MHYSDHSNLYNTDPVYPCRSSTPESLKTMKSVSNANDKNTFITTVNEQPCKRQLNAKKFPDK